MNGGREEGKKTHPPPGEPGSKGQMVATTWCDAIERRRWTRRWRWRREPSEQVTLLNASRGAAGAITKNGKHPRREYKKVALEAS